ITCGADVVGKLAAGKRGIAPPDQNHVTGESAILVERSVGLDGGAEFVVRANQRQGGGGREELAIRGRRGQFVRIQRVKDLAVLSRCNLYSPKATRQVWLIQDGFNLFFERNVLLQGSGLRVCEKQSADQDSGEFLAKHLQR